MPTTMEMGSLLLHFAYTPTPRVTRIGPSRTFKRAQALGDSSIATGARLYFGCKGDAVTIALGELRSGAHQLKEKGVVRPDHYALLITCKIERSFASCKKLTPLLAASHKTQAYHAEPKSAEPKLAPYHMCRCFQCDALFSVYFGTPPISPAIKEGVAKSCAHA